MGTVHRAGRSTHGRVWHGWSSDHWPASPTPLLGGCTDCAAGNGFVVAAKADGSLWMLGKAPAPTPLPDCRGGWVEVAGAGSAVVAVDACDGVIMAATAEGQLLSCGRGSALGLGEEMAIKGTAVLIALAAVPPVCSFSVGSLHGACVGR